MQVKDGGAERGFILVNFPNFASGFRNVIFFIVKI